MSPQILAAIVMFVITALFASAFMYPMTRFRQKNKVVNFYFTGFWVYLAMITALAGGQSTLLILGQNVSRFGAAILGAMTITFIMFVVFAWARLIFSGASHLLKRAIKT